MSFTYITPRFSRSTIQDNLPDCYDIVIIFHSIEDLSKTNNVEYTNLYCVTKIDNQILFMSTIVSDTSTFRWNNEEWTVRNVPSNAKLSISIYNKDKEKLIDNYIGELEIVNIINCYSPINGYSIVGSSNRSNGYFHLSIHSTKSSYESQKLPLYTFDGPCRYFRYDFLSFNTSNADCIYSIWKIQLRRISVFFPPNEHQKYHQQSKSARDIFTNYSSSLAAQNSTKLTCQTSYGRLASADDLWTSIFLDKKTQQIRPCAYNYIIDGNTWQFSEIDTRSFTDSVIKHSRMANCGECVRYAGEFHLRPKYGWNRLDGEWELVFDNASGTYSPNADLLVNLKQLLLFNFPQLHLTTYDYKDSMLKNSIEQLELAVEKHKRSMGTTANNKRISPYVSST